MAYRMVEKDGKVSFVEEFELNVDRKHFLELQKKNGNEPILFCLCHRNEMSDGIPMTLTNHEPTPHFQTKKEADRAKHFRFCRHFIDQNSKLAYKPAIDVDENGVEKARIEWNCDDDELEQKITDEEYSKKNRFQGNHNDKVIYGKMTFDAFIKYKNVQYFKINQFTHRIFDIDELNKNLFGWIMNAIINGSKVKDLSRGQFVYDYVKNIEELNNDTYRIVTKKNNFYCRKDTFEKAARRFAKTYNNLAIEKYFKKKDLFVICYGFKDTSMKYSKIKDLGFILVNKYGLYCESLNEAKVYNLICDRVFTDPQNGRLVFYKPLVPENDYSNPNFVSDGIITDKNTGRRAVVEIFGRSEQAYVNRKKEKLSSCKHILLSYDAINEVSMVAFEEKLEKFCEEGVRTCVI